MRQVLGCPDCGGEIELRGNVRCYVRVTATLDTETGLRSIEWGEWETLVETMTDDDPPYHCLDCDTQHPLGRLAPRADQGAAAA